ncbi:aminopeptidase-like protein, partial [Euroglyphus maynei]
MYRDDIKIGTADDLIKFNVDQKGLFILNYPMEQWIRWIETLNNNESNIWIQTSALDRNNLLMDAFYLARSGRLPYKQCLNLAEFLQFEKSYMVWSIASDMLKYLRVFMAVQDQSVAFDQWVLNKLIGKHYDDVKWQANTDDDINQRLHRSLILDLACEYGHQDCRQKASEYFDEYRQTSSSSSLDNYYENDPDILPIILYHAQKFNATDDKFKFLQERYDLANSTNEKMTYLEAMTATTDENMLRQLLNHSLDTTYIRTQDFFTFLSYMADNSIGLDLAWDFYRDHYTEIQQRFGMDDSEVGRAVYRFAFHFTTEKRREEVMELFQKYPEAGASALFRQQTMDLIDANIRWSKSFYKDVIEYVTNVCDSEYCPWNQFRLNPLVKPLHYELLIQIDTDSFKYNGTVKILLNIDDEIDHIILHAADILDVSSPKITQIDRRKQKERETESESNLSTGRGFTYSPLELYVIPLKMKTFKGDNYLLELNFDGNLLKGDQVGLYRGWYDNNNGTRINIAATQLESAHARKMFPCFDEPSFKSNISITVIHPKTMTTTLSNMDIISSEEIDGQWKETKFQTTPPMVTYLIAILVSDFRCTSNIDLRNLTINVCSSSSLYGEHHHEYSLNITAKILKFYENYTGIEYSLSKLDQIALPQFSSGAMENWGLIKYRQKKLMWSAMDNLSEEKKDTCTVIAHELAHMWFGDLVTMQFWGDLWLNEAFASFMEFKGMNSAHPEWNIWDTFVHSHTYKAIVGDYDQISQPLIRNVTRPKEMDYMTRIVYNKGAAILKMFENTMGMDEFQRSIRSYLNSLQYQTATSENIYAAFEENWPYNNDTQNAREFFQSWTEQIGFPYLNITCDDDKKSCSYTQERFIRNGDRPSNDLTYVIPFQYYTYDDEQQQQRELKKSPIQFLTKKTDKLDYFDFIKINPNFNGFYFINYSPEKWSKLISDLVANNNDIVSSLMVNDRSELITSSYFLSRAKLAPYSIALDMYNYLVHETHYIPWTLHSKLIANLAWEMERTEYRESYLHFERRLTRQHYNGIDFWNLDNTTIIDRMFRRILIQNSCGSGNRQCLKDAFEMFTKWKNQNETTIQPDLLSSTLSYGVKFSTNPEDYEFVWQKYLSEKETHSNKSDYLEALSYIADDEIVRKYLDLSLNESIVSNNHFVEFFVYIIHRYEHEQMIWKYFTENYSMLSRKLTTVQMDLLMTRFADHTVTEKRRLDIWNFLKDKQTGVSMNGQESTFARIEYNLAWMSNNKLKVGEWFGQNACGQRTPEPCPWAQTRIDQTIIQPKHYDLTIQVNLTTNIYNGSVVIQIEAFKPFEHIVLHAAQMLQVELFSVKNSNNDPIEDVSMFRYQPKQFIVIEFDEQQTNGTYELTFNFTANLLDAGISGLYLSNYTDGMENFKMASTQFEFFDARKVFPCFDEPAFKSKFAITIIHDKQMNTTISNMEVIESNPIPDTQWIRTRFNESLDMVTYLVAMAVSNFVCKHYMIENNQVNVGVCASHLQGHKLDYALEMAPKCLSHLEELLGHPYPMTKVDLIAIPDFSYGAMENWGLITFRETALLFHELDTTSERKMSMMNTIAHELAHFWFGNLVTCEWWDFIALNEAFATYMQYTTVDKVEPDWKTFDLFLISEFEYGLAADAKDNHPLIRNVTRTEQSEQADSNIIYSKGASILRMIESVMGTTNFYNALHDYLDKNQFKSVRPEMLLAEFDNQFVFNDSRQTVKMSDFIQDWFFSNGIPYINVTESNNGFYLVQDRFLLQESKNDTKPIWKIPIKYYIDSNWTNMNTEFMINETMNLTTPMNLQNPINLNARHSGYYLVNYPPNIWKQWIDTFMEQSTEIPVLDRSGLMMDAFYLAQANLLSYNVPLNLARYLINERHLSPWTTAIRGFSSIQRYISHSSSYEVKFREYLQNLIQPVYDDLGWNDTVDEPVTKRRLRSSILDFACFNQMNDCLKQTDQLFQNWIIGKQNEQLDRIPTPNLLSTVLEYGIQNSNSIDQWLFVWSQYSNETSSTLRSIYMNALAQTNDVKLLTMLLTQALDANQIIRSQDSYSVFIAISGCNNPKSLGILWKFFQNNYPKFIEKGSPLRLTQVSSLLSRISSGYFFTAEQKDEMKQFFAKYPNIGLTQNQRNDILNKIDNNINWIAKRMI